MRPCTAERCNETPSCCHLQAEIFRRAGLAQYTEVPRESVAPGACEPGSDAAAAAVELAGRLRDVALSRGDRDAAIAITAGRMGFYSVRLCN